MQSRFEMVLIVLRIDNEKSYYISYIFDKNREINIPQALSFDPMIYKNRDLIKENL